MPGCNVVVLCHDLAVAVALYRASLRCCGVPVLCLTPFAAGFPRCAWLHRCEVPIPCLVPSWWGSCTVPCCIAVGFLCHASHRRGGFLCHASHHRGGLPAPCLAPCCCGVPVPCLALSQWWSCAALHDGVHGTYLTPSQWGSRAMPRSGSVGFQWCASLHHGVPGQDSFAGVGAEEVLFSGDQRRRGRTSRESAQKRTYFQGIHTDEDWFAGGCRRRGLLHRASAQKRTYF